MRTWKYKFLLAALLSFLTESVYSQHTDSSAFHIKAQFAGELGLVSLGVGKEFLQDKLDADVFVGYLPEGFGGEQLVTAALKLAYVSFEAVQLEALDWHPLRTGLQLGYTFGDDYFAFEPRDKYPKGYYGFSTAFHLYYFLGGEVEFARVKHLEKFGLYYETGALGKYLVSYIKNPKYLSPGKVFHLALGIKLSL
ncbi:hypothetical protein POKO110462_19960 [Pontibacter korlensis]|uniref:Outer membrane protein beta-barrel domain-containing protein n=1 Tax=Pontibacter korlensis TaxID=400092 RepID=A0A0E3UXG1_9BACT|nr:hypothetical protein [Pontibacter korlensis]AKD04232.1 hypothetical protein PKOR_15490 [Pontibacter korlensis]